MKRGRMVEAVCTAMPAQKVIQSLLVFVTLAIPALGAPTTAVTQANQAGAAVAGLVGAVANAKGCRH